MRRIINSIIMALLLAATTPQAMAQALTKHEREVRDGYNYWLYSPPRVSETVTEDVATDSAKTPVTRLVDKPVIIFLHGASLCGTNMEKVRRYGTIDAIEKGRDIDAYVIAPQNPGGSWQPKRVMNVLEHVMAENPIDSTRIYIVGMSLGGYGTIDMVATYPDRIAAAMAFCGGGTVGDYGGLNEVPLWIVHGTADRAVGVSQSDKVVAAMRTADAGTPRLIYNRVPGMNHAQPARLFYLKESYDWLMSHSLNDDNREVATNSIMASNLIQNAYKGLRSTGKGASTAKKKATTSKKKGASSKKKRRRRKR